MNFNLLRITRLAAGNLSEEDIEEVGGPITFQRWAEIINKAMGAGGEEYPSLYHETTEDVVQQTSKALLEDSVVDIISRALKVPRDSIKITSTEEEATALAPYSGNRKVLLTIEFPSFEQDRDIKDFRFSIDIISQSGRSFVADWYFMDPRDLENTFKQYLQYLGDHQSEERSKQYSSLRVANLARK